MTIRITHLADAPSYSPPLHHDVAARRLQGHDAGATERFWVGQSTYAPGARADSAPTSEETVYVLQSGSLRLSVQDGVHDLSAGDSVHFSKGTVRQLENASEADATLLVIVALPVPSTAP